MSENLITSNTRISSIETPAQILKKIAEESFRKEQILYKNCKQGISPQIKDIELINVSSPDQVLELLKTENGFRAYQNFLSLNVYNIENQSNSFMRYFYDASFIKALSAKSPGDNLFSNILKELKQDYFSNDEEVEEKEFSGNVKELIDEIMTLSARDKGKLTQQKIMAMYLKKFFNIDREKNKNKVATPEQKEQAKEDSQFIWKYLKTPTDKKKAGIIKSAKIEGTTIDQFEAQLEKLVDKIVTLLKNSIDFKGKEDSFSEKLTEYIQNNVEFNIGVMGEVDIKGKKYQGKSASTALKNQKDTVTITYSDAKELFKQGEGKAGFKIKLLGGDSIFNSFFAGNEIQKQIQDLLKESNPSGEISGIANNNLIEIMSNITYIDKNLFYNYLFDKIDFSKFSKENLEKKTIEEIQKTAEQLSEGFGRILYSIYQDNLITGTTPEQAKINADQFKQWWDKSGKDNLEKLINNNAHLIYELGSKTSEANVAGTLGEVLFSLLIQENLQGGKVEVLGQTSHGHGQAAVDTKITFKDAEQNIQNVGFQIKNYSSLKGNTMGLYDDTSLLLSSEYMKRYIEARWLDVLQGIFFDKNREDFFLESTGIKETSIQAASNILNAHIPYFIRYDEAQVKDEIGIEQNNFYIINFSFIPASALFLLAAEALEEEVKKEQQKELFYFSSKIDEKDKDSSNLLLSITKYLTTKGYVENKNQKLSTTNFLQKDLVLNFKGFRVNFKEKMNTILSKA